MFGGAALFVFGLALAGTLALNDEEVLALCEDLEAGRLSQYPDELRQVCKSLAKLEEEFVAENTAVKRHLEKRKNEFIRFGKRKNEFIRFGKRKNEFIRFGKRKNEFIRFGKKNAKPETGTAETVEKRKNEFIRFG